MLDACRDWLAARPGRFVLGENVDGEPLRADLSEPTSCHLLIGGTTGSGKSVLLRSIAAGSVESGHGLPGRARHPRRREAPRQRRSAGGLGTRCRAGAGRVALTRGPTCDSLRRTPRTMTGWPTTGVSFANAASWS
ncbi:MAG: hypothetical protein HS104_16840 [Polyangiaceae bacterium]|nr:hypothetical protein [Polyangiaceae bacterium]MCE7894863.1 hypothetical protein [Sorangiineae bacterium PRO1]